jgi:hypothetical protein
MMIEASGKADATYAAEATEEYEEGGTPSRSIFAR